MNECAKERESGLGCNKTWVGGWVGKGLVDNLVISSNFEVVVLLSVTDQVMYIMHSLLTSSSLPSRVQRNERYVCYVAQGGSKGIGLARGCS